jgi:ParB family chromosome partitioning protein
MKLDFIPIDKLFVDKTNMRARQKRIDLSDILPSIRQRGVLQTLLVRPANDGLFGIVAGARRFAAARRVAEEQKAADPAAERMLLPCAILDDGDDATAVEASMLENLARLEPDEVSQWESFVRLVKEGRTPAEIGLTFGLPDLAVRRVLALGNLLPRIRDLYRREAIDTASVRCLTLASKRQQQAWLALHDDPDAHCPTGHRLKAWLFGGNEINAAFALFDVAASGLETVTDLFGEEVVFADTAAFWTAQEAAIAERREAYLAQGWTDVIVLPRGEYHASWEYAKTAKRKGGLVYVQTRDTGEVIFHEGFLNRTAQRAAARGDVPAPKPVRPEVTSSLQTYIDLHRHAAVRAVLADTPSVALRLMVAHAIVGSPLWSVRVEPQASRNEAVRESVETCLGETAFDFYRRAALDLLGMDAERATVTRNRSYDDGALAALFVRLLGLPDPDVMAILAVVMGETLASGGAALEAVGAVLGVRMADHWQADGVFFDLIRDKEVLRGIVGEVAGEAVASANKDEKAKALKQIVRDCLDGANGRTKVEQWVPRWMAFPPAAYTSRGGVGSVAAAARVAAVTPTPLPETAAVGLLPAPKAESEMSLAA